ncbi:hypothetical protein EJ04DRAFT_482411 [Polyplosphaeria fusca]|uniref:Amidohydrolase-related domain-containing protein n=1 Tax=Polyplosphaeria fusca TaxID=682080 RepID=A0A9P4R7N0_9PLEO|nr:hypothetical protein EJ04DRAFT_482411 [Polyplosphaeria fusca]
MRVFRALLIAALTGTHLTAAYSTLVQSIIDKAKNDSIDLESQPWSTAAFQAIDDLQNSSVAVPPAVENATKIDTHVHAVPQFYLDIMPVKPGSWSIEQHLELMANLSIAHAVLSIPWPGASIYAGNQSATVALARIVNEYLGELCRVLPKQFSYVAVVPLPYVDLALREAKYALTSLGAVGIGLFTNHEGYYLGNTTLDPFFSGLNTFSSTTKKAIFVHPAMPRVPPAVKNAATVDFYWETAQAITGLTLSLTLQNYTSLDYQFSHGGGAFPSIWDRLFDQSTADFKSSSEKIYRKRLNWDSAGPVYPRQIQGLLAYDIPKKHLTYGTDFPFNIGDYAANTQGVSDASFLTSKQKEDIFRDNALEFYPKITV